MVVHAVVAPTHRHTVVGHHGIHHVVELVEAIHHLRAMVLFFTPRRVDSGRAGDRIAVALELGSAAVVPVHHGIDAVIGHPVALAHVGDYVTKVVHVPSNQIVVRPLGALERGEIRRSRGGRSMSVDVLAEHVDPALRVVDLVEERLSAVTAAGDDRGGEHGNDERTSHD
jgi:hypothetical protein